MKRSKLGICLAAAIFEVCPANAFGAQGEPIRSEPRSFNPTPCATTLW